MRPSRTSPLSGGTVHWASSPTGKVSRCPLKISRRPGVGAESRASRLTTPGSGSTARTLMPGIAASRARATLAMSAVSLGGLGEATRTSAWVIAINRGTWRATSSASCSGTPVIPLLVGKAALPQANRHRQRPANKKIDDGNEGENFERTEGGGGKLHATAGYFADRNHRAERRKLNELHEIRGQRRQGHADGLRQDDAAKGLYRRQAQHLGRLAVALGDGLDAGAIDLGDERRLIDRQPDDEGADRTNADPEHDRQHVVDPQQLHQDRRVADDFAKRHADPAQEPPSRHIEPGNDEAADH